MQDKMSELLVFEDVMKESEGQWPVEVLVTVGEGPAGQLTVLDRDSYKEIASHSMNADSEKGERSPGECRLSGRDRANLCVCVCVQHSRGFVP